MRARSVILISIGILLAVSVSLSWLIPPIDDLWVGNPFWNGLSEVQSSLKPMIVTSVDEVEAPAYNSTLLLLGPSSAFTESQIVNIRSYLEAGGRVILTDDFGTGNSLLEGLGTSARFSGQLLQDNLFKERRMMPRIIIIENSTETTGVKELVMNYPTELTGVQGTKVLAYASYFSTVGNSSQLGPFPVFAKVEIGRGTLYLISDSSIFINGMLTQGDNKILLQNLVRGVSAIDEVHSTPTRLTAFKGSLSSTYDFLGYPEVKYSLAIILIVGVFKVRWTDYDEQPDEVEETLKRHPEWSRRELEELREARRKAHGGK